MAGFSMVELIERKRDGGELTPDELRWIIAQYTADVIPDYQMSSLLMAIVLNDMTSDELGHWTEAMLHSGDVVDLGHLDAPRVGKHSTGGVGDKVSIPLAPLVAACGVAVPMMSGRGLGHTGGTLDKLETIPGFRTALDPTEFIRVVETCGIVLAGQSETMVPADRRIYALRDASGTVPSIDLISSSIMSKKLAEGSDALVLDVKVGRGAFMKDEQTARQLAETMVGIGAWHGTKVVAILTDMDQPLGREVGNANEIRESIEVLHGGGPDDVREVVLRLGEEMLVLAGIASDLAEARRCLIDEIESGAAAAKFEEMVAAQGGDPAIVEDPSLLPGPDHVDEILATRSGFVTRCDAYTAGTAAVRLGAGRAKKEDDIDPAVGITILNKVGDPVEKGEPLARIGWNEQSRLEAARALLAEAWEIADQPAPTKPLIIGEVR
jgi:pyrimidine-nucleoside phosphorylase